MKDREKLKERIIKIVEYAYDRDYSEWGQEYHDDIAERILQEIEKEEIIK